MSYIENYKARIEPVLKPMAAWIQDDLHRILESQSHVDRICSRVKSIESFQTKASKTEEGKFIYTDPLNQIQDQVGVRVIVFYLDDVERIAEKIRENYKEVEYKNHIPDSESEFGYVGKHFIFKVPSDFKKNVEPRFFELQIKTLFQHAWAEANHDLVYKPKKSLSVLQKRKVAFTAAQAWGADTVFNELFLDQTDHPKSLNPS